MNVLEITFCVRLRNGEEPVVKHVLPHRARAAALTQWIVPLTLRLEVAPPTLLSEIRGATQLDHVARRVLASLRRT